MLVTFGNYIGTALTYYLIFGFVLVFPFVIAIYLVCLLKYRCFQSNKARRSIFERLLLEGDLWFGWFHPLIYLLFLYPAMWGVDRFGHTFLQGFSLFVLSAFWLARVTPLPALQEDWTRVWSSRLALFTIIPHIAIGVCYFLPKREMEILFPLFLFAVAIHYLAPIAMTAMFARRTDAGLQSEFMVSRSFRLRTSAWGFAVVLVFMSVISLFHRTESTAQELLTRHSEQIRRTAEANHISEPAFIAVLKTSITRTEFWKPAFEEGLMAFWLSDEKSHMGISKSLDMSIGVAQIKPTTMLVALMIQEKCTKRLSGDTRPYGPFAIKSYRDVSQPGEEWDLDAQHCQMAKSPLSGTPSKTVIVNTLLNEEQSIAAAGFILGLYNAQWSQAGIDIHDNPEILATLYQIGFERSHPHQDPKANRFGRAAGEFAKAQRP